MIDGGVCAKAPMAQMAYIGGEQDMMALPSKGRKDARTGTLKESSEGDTNTTNNSEVNLLKEPKDEEAATDRNDTPSTSQPLRASHRPRQRSIRAHLTHRLRTISQMQLSAHCLLKTFFYSQSSPLPFSSSHGQPSVAHGTLVLCNRGLWAALQLVLVTEWQ